MKTNERIHVALSPWDLTDDYNRHAGVTLISILEHSKKSVTVHLLYDERLCAGKEQETEHNKSCYQKIADRYDCRIEYHHIEVPEWVMNLPSVKKWTPGTLLRLHLAEILHGVDKILYFDCDMVINTSIDTLWDIELHDTVLGACVDVDIPYFSRKRKRRYSRLNIPINTYFCAGTLILNLSLLRKDSGTFTKTIYQFLANNPDLPFLDQDMLNWYCQGKYTELPKKYNIYTNRQDALKYCDDAVIHYAAVKKPWKYYSGDIEGYYWKYAPKTPWLENRAELVTALLSITNTENGMISIGKNFFSLLEGTRKDKAKYTLKFIGSIIKSCIDVLKK